MNETNESPTFHAHIRSSDPSAFVLEHVKQLQAINDKVDRHEEKIVASDKQMVILSKNLTDINSNISAVKWAVIGCAVMLVVNQFGLISTVKMWLFR
jgi:hypothetical protein